MRRRFVVLSALGLITAFWATAICGGWNPGKTTHGFTLLEKRFVKEVNAECLLFTHVKSGARLLKIAADDPNKTFSIAFKTVPESDSGTPHILEHAVLNGSEHFPVKSPFDVLSKGSLNTFLNAMTARDVTWYPVASMNNKDYFNLMHVYCDAVFRPLITRDPRIFKQEGWHYELTDTAASIVFRGVVYNEMKGAFSTPTRELDHQIFKNLFPDNGYRFSSGGYPSAIPNLTRNTFLDFHRRYYHPSNCYIFLYGDADLEKELAFLDSEYLSEFTKTDKKAVFPIQPPFNAMKNVEAYYPVPAEGNADDQTYLGLGFVAGLNTDPVLIMALDILREVLVGHESAPVRLALQEAGIGREVNAQVDNYQQNVFLIVSQNARTADKDRFYETVKNTLQKAVENGLDKKMVEGALNRLEFGLREGDDAQKGITYNNQALAGWLFGENPFQGLEYEKPLADLKAGIANGLLETLIRTHMLKNPHALLLVLKPKPGLEDENNAVLEQRMTRLKKGLSSDSLLSLARETQALIAFQKREDTSEALATIPLLDLKDIRPRADWFDVAQSQVNGVPVLLHDTFTNGVTYVTFHFDARVLPDSLIPYASLLTELLGSLDTENMSYGELNNTLNVFTGGFNTALAVYPKDQDDRFLLPKFEVSSKAMNNRTDKLFDLAAEIITRTRFDDPDRLKTVLLRHQSRLEARIKRAGLNYALSRLASYMTNQGLFNEKIRGIEYYKFITGLTQNIDGKMKTLTSNLSKTAGLLFARGNLTVALTCPKKDFDAASASLARFLEILPDRKDEITPWIFVLEKKNEGLCTASKVQFVTKGYDFKKLGYTWTGKMRVLNQVLSSEWLQNQIRVIGGAYGGFSIISPDGQFQFASYRDPNLGETLKNYDATPDYLRKFQADGTAMTRFIIGTIAGMDQPLTPSQKGALAVQRVFENTTRESVQKERDEVLTTTAQDIRNMEKLVADIVAQNAICVYGNDTKVKSEKDLFGDLVELTR